MTSHRTPQELPTAPLGALALAMLMLGSLAQGAEAQDAPPPSGKAREAAATDPVPAPAAPPKAAAPAPPANPTGAPPRRFIPTEQVSEDRAVAFPKDI